MINLYPIDSISQTPFDFKWGKEYLQENNIFITNDQKKSNLFITKWLPSINTLSKFKFFLKHKTRKTILLWTNEPRYSTVSYKYRKGGILFPDVYYMNLYNENIYINNYSYYGFRINRKIDFVSEKFVSKNKIHKIVGLATYVKNPESQKLIKNGKNIDLVEKRQNLLLDGHNRKLIDIYGKNWPKGVAIANSRESKNWREDKEKILLPYKFNVCLENTDYKYYVSEKIWDSIIAKCLPIYRGSEDFIYEEFPRNSFIDYNNFENHEDLFNFIKHLSIKEYCSRLNLCIETYNGIFERDDFKDKRKESLDLIVKKIYNITGGGND